MITLATVPTILFNNYTIDRPIYEYDTINPIEFNKSYNTLSDDYAYIDEVEYIFDNGIKYFSRRHYFTGNSDKYTSSFNIKGDDNTIKIRYLSNERWIETSNYEKTFPVTMLYIETNKENMVISPAMLQKHSLYGCVEFLRDMEEPISITKNDDGYSINVEFNCISDSFGDIWAIKSKYDLIDWNDYTENYYKVNDLSDKQRWTYDGYFMECPTSYMPNGENIYFKNPANYVGKSFSSYYFDDYTYNIGFTMMDTALKNINSDGYFESNYRSSWLYEDFGLSENYYDTRFNTDLFTGYIRAYKRYEYDEFLEAAKNYGDFLVDYFNEHNYKYKDGILVEDYMHKNGNKKTDASLNHNLANVNFLFYLYDETLEKKYYDSALKVLKGVENTVDDWIMEDNNLEYAINYSTGYHKLVDYPYLTYNDLFETRSILINHDLDYSYIQKLMDSKKKWMDANGITEYTK
ncbi:MAG: hypothetical protein ACK5LV_00660 [Lachnospirales bacterium]